MSDRAADAIDPAARRRLQWRARRGMAELDLILGAFLRAAPAFSAEEGEAFERLLTTPDGVLLEWLMGRATPTDAELAALVGRIRGHVTD